MRSPVDRDAEAPPRSTGDHTSTRRREGRTGDPVVDRWTYLLLLAVPAEALRAVTGGVRYAPHLAFAPKRFALGLHN
jgi:hypothetical protein